MNHNWIDVDFTIPVIKKKHCTLCGVDSYIGVYDHNTVNYLWLKPMGEIQPACPESCEDTAELIKLFSSK